MLFALIKNKKKIKDYAIESKNNIIIIIILKQKNMHGKQLLSQQNIKNKIIFPFRGKKSLIYKLTQN